MVRPMILAVIISLLIGIGASYFTGILTAGGLVISLIAISCLILPMSIVVINYNRQRRYNFVK